MWGEEGTPARPPLCLMLALTTCTRTDTHTHASHPWPFVNPLPRVVRPTQPCPRCQEPTAGGGLPQHPMLPPPAGPGPHVGHLGCPEGPSPQQEEGEARGVWPSWQSHRPFRPFLSC